MPDICNSQMFKLINTSFTVQTGTTTHSGVVFPPGASSIKTGRHGSPSPSLIPVHLLLYFRDLPLILGFSISRRLVTMKAHVLVKNTVKYFLCPPRFGLILSYLILKPQVVIFCFYLSADYLHCTPTCPKVLQTCPLYPRPVPKYSRHAHKCSDFLDRKSISKPYSN